MDPNTNTPIVVLKGIDSDNILPIWVGAFEANAIALEIEKIVPQRPMTHDLIRNIILQSGLQPSKVIINDLVDNTFYALIEFIDQKGNVVSIDSRPSDAIAISLRLDCPIFVVQKVIDLSSANTKQNDTEFEVEDTFKANEEWPDLIT